MLRSLRHEVCEILVSPGLPHFPDAGFGDSRSNQHHRHRAQLHGPQINQCTQKTNVRLHNYLFQRVSVAVQRYNSVAFRGTSSVHTVDEPLTGVVWKDGGPDGGLRHLVIYIINF